MQPPRLRSIKRSRGFLLNTPVLQSFQYTSYKIQRTLKYKKYIATSDSPVELTLEETAIRPSYEKENHAQIKNGERGSAFRAFRPAHTGRGTPRGEKTVTRAVCAYSRTAGVPRRFRKALQMQPLPGRGAYQKKKKLN